MEIAIVQLGSWGDNINSTLMLEPIKKAHPGCTIEVHTTSLYQSAFRNNPHIDKITAYPCGSKTECFDLYNTIPIQVAAMGYDRVFTPAPILCLDRTSLRHPELGNNLICSFVRCLEEAGIEYDWPVRTVMQLEPDEVQNVDNWVSMAQIQLADHQTVLMEVQGESGQSFWNHTWTMAAVRHLMRRPRTNVIISRRDKTKEVVLLEKEFPKRVYWAGALSIRECAELYNRCDAFLSISSGLSNACNTNHCRQDLTWVETVNSPTVTSAPIRATGKVFWYENNIQAFLRTLARSGL